MKAGHTEFMAAEDGVIVVNDTTEYSARRFYGFYVSADAVIASLEINGDTVTDVKADYFTTPASGVKAGVTITAHGDDTFSAITLTSGEVALILA